MPTTLKEILEAEGVNLVKHYKDEEFCSSCPKCGGKDRFVYFTKSDRYMCRQCAEKGGDAIQYLRDFRGMTFREAEALVHGDNGHGKSQSAQRSKKIKTFYYHNENGEVVYRIHRWEPGFHGGDKDFTQEPPNGKGGWKTGRGAMDGVIRVLYRLPEVIKAETVFVVEGEGVADVLAKYGVTSTTNPGGAGKWPKLDREHQIGVPLERKRVFILPDNDKLGRKHAQDIAASLHGKADISIIELPGLPKKGDIVDFFEKQGPENAAKLLIDLCVAAKQWTPSTETTAPAGEPLRTNDSLGAEIDIPDYHFTDLGNAERLIRNHKGTILFCYPYNQWLRWDRRTWPVDISGDIERKAKETIKKIYREASAAADEDQRTAIAKHAMRSESGSKIKSMLELARMDVPVLPKDLDADPWLFNIQNGTVDLKTGQLQPHNSGDLITKISTVIYDPGAKCPLFESFLDRITQSRSGLIDFLQRTVGYALTGLTIEQCFFVLYGIGANGKTTFLEVLRKVLGDYGQQANFATFLNTRSKNSSNDLAALKGARVVCASESGAGQSLNESLIKHITGGEAIRARFLWGEFFEYYPEFKIFLASNHRPPIRNADLGIWRRVRLIPFDEVIPIEEQDQDLLEKLFEELPGILNWMLKGCLDWQKNKLGMSEEVKQATDLYKSESDVFGTFFEEKCIFTPEVEVKSGDLQKAYRRWCEKSGEKPAPLHILTDNLKMRGCSTKRTNQGRFWEGIGLLGGET